MATGLGSDIPLGRLGMFILGKLGGRTPLGRELRRTGTLGSLGRVPSISTWLKDGRCEGEEEECDEKWENNEKMKGGSDWEKKAFTSFPAPPACSHSSEP